MTFLATSTFLFLKVTTIKELRRQPSFPEFVDWLIQDRSGKEATRQSWEEVLAWRPYYTVCPVCQRDFTILKLDSESNEMDHFIKTHRLPLESSAKIHAKGGVRNSLSKADKYFSQLGQDQVMSLYYLYKIDFEMFGYNQKRYVEMTKN